jgi:hypothetical protein
MFAAIFCDATDMRDPAGELTRTRKIRVAIAALLSAALIPLAGWHVDWVAAMARLAEASLVDLAMSGACALAALLARSQRLRVRFGDEGRSPGLPDYVAVAGFHQALFTLLPSGTGDFALPVLARTWLGSSGKKSLWIIVTVRLEDLIVLASIGAVSAGLLWLPAPGSYVVGSLAVLAAIGALRAVPGPRSGTWTIVSWLAAVAALSSVLAALGLSFTLPQVGLMLCGLNVAGALALVTFAGLGFVDAGLFAMLRLYGVPVEFAAQITIAARAILLTLNVVLPALVATLALTIARPPPISIR